MNEEDIKRVQVNKILQRRLRQGGSKLSEESSYRLATLSEKEVHMLSQSEM